MEERIKVTILGVEVGTASGWDDNGSEGGLGVQFYDFESTYPGLNSASCLSIDYDQGIIQSIADDGETTDEGMIISLFGH